jgi:AraC family transcriptional regulator
MRSRTPKDENGAMLADIQQTSAALRSFVHASRLDDGDQLGAGYAVGDLLSLISEWIDAIDSAFSIEEPHKMPTRGGLAPWQVRRLSQHIEAHIDSIILIEDLARLCRLSTSHFTRAFRASYGYSPHRFIMRRRIEHAQGLMLATNAPLGQIALECGLADQSHFTRLFRRFIGESPGTWRRSRGRFSYSMQP